MNLGQLSEKLEAFTQKAIENVKKAQMDTAFDIQKDMYNNAPVDTGEYRESIQVYEQEVNGNKISVDIGTDYKVRSLAGNEYLLGYLLESGTAPHDIYPVRAEYLRFRAKDGRIVYTKHVSHPGTNAQPHILPALNSNVRNYKDRLLKAIREAKK